MVVSSHAVLAASPQNSQAYSTNGRSLWARAEKRVAVSMPRGEKKGNKQNFSKNGKTNTARRGAAYFRSGILSRSAGSKE